MDKASRLIDMSTIVFPAFSRFSSFPSKMAYTRKILLKNIVKEEYVEVVVKNSSILAKEMAFYSYQASLLLESFLSSLTLPQTEELANRPSPLFNQSFFAFTLKLFAREETPSQRIKDPSLQQLLYHHFTSVFLPHVEDCGGRKVVTGNLLADNILQYEALSLERAIKLHFVGKFFIFQSKVLQLEIQRLFPNWPRQRKWYSEGPCVSDRWVRQFCIVYSTSHAGDKAPGHNRC
jgi:hypothetical protein